MFGRLRKIKTRQRHEETANKICTEPELMMHRPVQTQTLSKRQIKNSVQMVKYRQNQLAWGTKANIRPSKCTHFSKTRLFSCITIVLQLQIYNIAIHSGRWQSKRQLFATKRRNTAAIITNQWPFQFE